MTRQPMSFGIADNSIVNGCRYYERQNGLKIRTYGHACFPAQGATWVNYNGSPQRSLIVPFRSTALDILSSNLSFDS